MSGLSWRASDESYAARHTHILTDLVMVFALAARHNRNFGKAVEAIPAWQAARGIVLGDRAGADARPADTTASALLRDLVTGMQEAAERDPAVARLFSRKGWSAWTVATWAVGDARQWRRALRVQQPGVRHARPAADARPRPPAAPPNGRSGPGRRL